MEILNFILTLTAIIGLGKWFMVKEKVTTLKAELREAHLQLRRSSAKNCSEYLSHSDLERIFGDCLRF